MAFSGPFYVTGGHTHIFSLFVSLREVIGFCLRRFMGDYGVFPPLWIGMFPPLWIMQIFLHSTGGTSEYNLGRGQCPLNHEILDL